VGQDQESEKLTRENKTSRNNTYYLITNCLYGQFLGLQEMNDTCRTVMHIGMMNRGFNVCSNSKKSGAG
jgi:hypothetical protein